MVIGDLRQPSSFNRDTPEDQRAALEQWCKENGAGYGWSALAIAAAAGLALGWIVFAASSDRRLTCPAVLPVRA